MSDSEKMLHGQLAGQRARERANLPESGRWRRMPSRAAEPAARHFDVTISCYAAKDVDDDACTEDLALTDYLTRAWLELASLSWTPVPRCPHCDGLQIRLGRRSRNNQVPAYRCMTCRRSFNRFTGTPFARLRNQAKAGALIPMLSRQTSLSHACDRTGLSYEGIVSWLLAFRRYLLELDPSGGWESRVRLGMHALPHARCARCGFEGGFISGGFDPQRRRRIRCPQCGRHQLLDVSQIEGHAVDAVVVRDSVRSAVRRQRKYRPDAPPLPVNPAARVDAAMPDVATRTLQKIDEVVLPARRMWSRKRRRHEDFTLSGFLLKQVDAALSMDRTPCPCPWCGSERTDYHPYKRPSGLPGFRCEACLSYFTRVSNTPLLFPSARAHARRFATMLGWRESYEAIAKELGVSRKTIGNWTHAWRRWLLLLDPDGAMEARVKLGLSPRQHGEAAVESGHVRAPIIAESEASGAQVAAHAEQC